MAKLTFIVQNAEQTKEIEDMFKLAASHFGVSIIPDGSTIDVALNWASRKN